MNYFRFFLGTPRRLLTTLVGLGLVIVMISPGILETAANRLVVAMMPLLAPVLTIIIVLAGVRMILRSGK